MIHVHMYTCTQNRRFYGIWRDSQAMSDRETPRSLPRRLSRDLTSSANRKSLNRRACQVAKVMRDRSETLKCAEKSCKQVRFGTFCAIHMVEKQDDCRPFPIPDKASSVCQNPRCSESFSFMNRRHHCRRCGLLYCGKCSNRSIAIPALKYSSPVRVCETCYEYEKHMNACQKHSSFIIKGGRLHKFMKGIAKNVSNQVKGSIKTSFKTLFKSFRDSPSKNTTSSSIHADKIKNEDESKDLSTVGHDVHVWIEIDPYRHENSRICWKNFTAPTTTKATTSMSTTTNTQTNSSTSSISFLTSPSKTRMSTVRHKMRHLRDVKTVTKGIQTQTLRSQYPETSEDDHLFLFSLIFEDRSIDFQSYGKKEYEAWLNGLNHAIAYSKLSPSAHPHALRTKILFPALSAEMKYSSEEARKEREAEEQYQSTVLTAREKFEKRQKDREARLKQLREWKTKK